MVSQAIVHSRTKKAHKSHIPADVYLSFWDCVGVMKTPPSKAVTKPRDYSPRADAESYLLANISELCFFLFWSGKMATNGQG